MVKVNKHRDGDMSLVVMKSGLRPSPSKIAVVVVAPFPSRIIEVT